ncbi:outer membrane beta-barrel protein [bacterium]|nr:outer membrane beta-barrel protein [bacterium]
MKRGIFIAGLAISIMILLSSQVIAQGGKIHIGKLTIIPKLAIQGVYDNNIYLGNGTNDTTELEESDWITHVMPALGFNYSFPERGSLSFGYAGDLAYYSDNNDNDWQTHKCIFCLNYKAPGGLILGIDNTYIDAEDPHGNLEEYRTGLKTKRWDNDLKTRIGYDFGNRFQILGYYNYFKQEYDLERDYNQNHDNNEFGVGFQVRFLPKTWGFVRYHFGERNYLTHPATTNVTESNDSDYKWQRVNVGLTWDPGAKLSGELNFGYQWRDYDNTTDPSGNRYEDKDTWIAATSITYTMTPTTSLALGITRALRETGSNDNEYYKDAGIGINFRQIIMTKFILIVGGAYNENSYNLPVNNERKDDNYRANIGLDYRIKDWLTAGVGYKYKEKKSNYDVNDYTDRQFIVELSAVY